MRGTGKASHLNGVRHSGTHNGVSISSTKEGIQFGPEQEIVLLAESDAQSQRALHPCPLGDSPAVSGQAPPKVQQRMRRRSLGAVSLDYEGREVIPARLAQGMLGELLHYRSEAWNQATAVAAAWPTYVDEVGRVQVDGRSWWIWWM